MGQILQQQRKGVEVLLRPKGENKSALKEKIVAIYETIFAGVDPSIDKPRFWDELFLLAVNIPFLDRCLILTREDQLLALQPILNKLFKQCLIAMNDTNNIRVAHSIETFSVLFRGLFRKSFTNFVRDILNIICGIQFADQYFKDFLNRVKELLIQPNTPEEIKEGVIRLVIIIITATDNINQNTLLEYFMQVDLLPSFIHTIENSFTSEKCKTFTIFAITLLSHHRKYEYKNPYQSIIADMNRATLFPPLLMSFAHDLTNSYHFQSSVGSSSSSSSLEIDETSTFEKLTSLVTFWMPSPPVAVSFPSAAQLGSTLLSVYDWSSNNTLFRGALCSLSKDANSQHLFEFLLHFSTRMLHDVQNLHQACYSKICLMIFLCLVEDPLSCSLLHDPLNDCLSPPFLSDKLKMITKGKKLPVCIILDILILFLKTNLRKKMQFGLYIKALNIIQRIICFQKHSKPHVNYKWKDIWDALFFVIKFISSADLFTKPEIIQIATEITTIFNLFITYGDSFLGDASDYDDLFYELIHQSKLLQQFINTAENSKNCNTLVMLQENINTIIRHFNGKLDQWQIDHPTATLSQSMVVEIIQFNYATLKLNLLDGLDQYERYLENPKEITFFKQFVRMVIFDFKAAIVVQPIPLRVILNN